MNMAVTDHHKFKASQLKSDASYDTPASGHIYFSFGNILNISGSAVAGNIIAPTRIPGQLVLTLQDTLEQPQYSRDDTINQYGGLKGLVRSINKYNGFTRKNLAGDDNIIGSQFNDTLRGFAGNDKLDAGEGNDTLDGGKGIDTLLGGVGDDVYIVDNAADQIIEYAAQGIDTVKTALANYQLGDDLENLTLTGRANRSATGNALDNVMIGNAGKNKLFGLAGNDVLDGSKRNNLLYGGEGNDTYIVNNKKDKLIELTGEGIDSVESRISYSLLDTDGKNGNHGGNIENLTLTGKTNINAVGNELDNVLIGNVGNNKLTGGAGIDTLNGAEGNDSYVFNSANEHTQAEIADTGTDANDIDTVSFAPLKSSYDNTLTLYAGDTGIEQVRIDSNKSAIDLNIDASQVGNGLVIIGHNGVNSIHGTDYADTLKGMAGNDILVGGLGNDILDGGLGGDVMQGGDGDDTYFVDNKDDTIIDTSGLDTVKSVLNNYILDSELENLTLLAGVLKGTGNALDNVITGNSEDNIIDGGAGNDTLNGGAGNDIYLFQSADDHVQAEINDTDGIDQVHFVATEASTLTLYADDVGIDQVVLGSANDTTSLSVDASQLLKAVTITGNAGDNSLTGTSKNDTLDGGKGADALDGGDGDDTYMVDHLDDTIIDSGGTDTVIVKTALHDYHLMPDIENLTLLNGGPLYGFGNELDNIIAGNSSANFLSGGDGADKLIGNEGNDILDGGKGIDTLKGGSGDDNYNIDITDAGDMEDAVIEESNQGIDTIELIGFSSNLIAFDLILGANLENMNVIATGKSNVNLFGNGLNNNLIGNDADNIIDGGKGNDTLTGGAGNDTLTGGADSDTLTGGAGNDVFVFSSVSNKAANFDTITDFVTKQDSIYLFLSVFTALEKTGSLNADYFITGSAAKDENDYIIYDSSTGKIFYDPDGSGTAAQVALVSLVGTPELTFNDFYVG